MEFEITCTRNSQPFDLTSLPDWPGIDYILEHQSYTVAWTEQEADLFFNLDVRATYISNHFEK